MYVLIDLNVVVSRSSQDENKLDRNMAVRAVTNKCLRYASLPVSNIHAAMSVFLHYLEKLNCVHKNNIMMIREIKHCLEKYLKHLG